MTALLQSVTSSDVVGEELDQILNEGYELNKGLADIVKNVEVPPSVVAKQLEKLDAEQAVYLDAITKLQKQYLMASKKGDKALMDSTQQALDLYAGLYNSTFQRIQEVNSGEIPTEKEQLRIATELFQKEEERRVTSGEAIKTARRVSFSKSS